MRNYGLLPRSRTAHGRPLVLRFLQECRRLLGRRDRPAVSVSAIAGGQRTCCLALRRVTLVGVRGKVCHKPAANPQLCAANKRDVREDLRSSSQFGTIHFEINFSLAKTVCNCHTPAARTSTCDNYGCKPHYWVALAKRCEGIPTLPLSGSPLHEAWTRHARIWAHDRGLNAPAERVARGHI